MGELHVRRRRHGLGTGYGRGSKAGVGDKGAKQSPCDHAISLWVVSHDSKLKHRGEQDCWTTFLDDCLSISDSAILRKSRGPVRNDRSSRASFTVDPMAAWPFEVSLGRPRGIVVERAWPRERLLRGAIGVRDKKGWIGLGLGG